ncbi:hypothetical protein C3451_10040 [Enterobacter sp. 301B]|nr:hypothetical protein C3451_10040 [Enterobacter sp. 301B]TXV55103.1 hypothetical protein D4M82_08220 [Enterobacter hormaechei]TXW33960.1 hypothetical protein D4M51_10205 [Enterobacter hormaechei]TXX11385.1 hypothetical protein D4M55_07800 [Enterobacter hormaechei]TYF78660.1 hypothetical protein DJ539_01780 [Enterobacter hormaechei]
MSLVRVQSEEPNLKSLLLEQAFCFSAFSKIVGWRCAYPTYGPVGPVSAAPPGNRVCDYSPLASTFLISPITFSFLEMSRRSLDSSAFLMM